MKTSFEKREEIIPIEKEDCQKILLLGTTGAGKTTLLRQLIGVFNFPSTSTSRTTIHDIEILSKNVNDYEAVVTFISEDETRNYIEDCVSDAIFQYIKTEDEERMMKHFLFHENMKFRLGYIIGKPFKAENNTEIKDLGFEFEVDDDNDNDVKKEEKKAFVKSEKIQIRLNNFSEKLKEISNIIEHEISSVISIDIDTIVKEDTVLYFEQHDKIIRQNNNIQDFIDEVLEAVKETFNYITQGEKEETNNWINLWKYKTHKRDDFIKIISSFSSNNANDYGRLLAPLVNGMRIKGRFLANYHKPTEFKEFIFIDGEGLGHNIDTSSNLSENITNKFKFIDKILLIDNAEQPMQAAPIMVLKNATAYGIQRKIILAFTHFDQVKGANFSNDQDKKDHIDFTVNNVLNNIGKERGKLAQKSLETTISKNKFFLSDIQNRKLKRKTAIELRNLVEKLAYNDPDIESLENPQITFSSSSLDDYILEAIQKFRELWNDYFGFSYQPKYKKVHWATLKAFTKRITWGQNEYSNLTPVQDLTYNLNTSIELFLENSILDPHIFNDNDKINTFDKIKETLRKKFYKKIKNVLIDIERYNMWEDAYYYTGIGSSRKRAFTIQKIYNNATFDIQESIRKQKESKFFFEIKKIVAEAIEENNCYLTE